MRSSEKNKALDFFNLHPFVAIGMSSFLSSCSANVRKRQKFVILIDNNLSAVVFHTMARGWKMWTSAMIWFFLEVGIWCACSVDNTYFLLWWVSQKSTTLNRFNILFYDLLLDATYSWFNRTAFLSIATDGKTYVWNQSHSIGILRCSSRFDEEIVSVGVTTTKRPRLKFQLKYARVVSFRVADVNAHVTPSCDTKSKSMARVCTACMCDILLK